MNKKFLLFASITFASSIFCVLDCKGNKSEDVYYNISFVGVNSKATGDEHSSLDKEFNFDIKEGTEITLIIEPEENII